MSAGLLTLSMGMGIGLKLPPFINPKCGLMKGGNFDPTPIDRVNKSISKNMRLT